MDFKKLKVYSNDLLKSIIDIINKDKKYVEGRIEYNGKAICIEDDYGTRFWIRLSLNKDDKLIVDLSTIELKEEFQRKGIFNEICKMIQNKDYVKSAFISNICTEKMFGFCKKYEFEFIESLNAYKVK